jgi:hypothetical protein
VVTVDVDQPTGEVGSPGMHHTISSALAAAQGRKSRSRGPSICDCGAGFQPRQRATRAARCWDTPLDGSAGDAGNDAAGSDRRTGRRANPERVQQIVRTAAHWLVVLLDDSKCLYPDEALNHQNVKSSRDAGKLCPRGIRPPVRSTQARNRYSCVQPSCAAAQDQAGKGRRIAVTRPGRGWQPTAAAAR